ncbi:hypothetical protein RZS08_38795, partial [Arthrospira platensis SPKY1]|nr:hypothetical protein [Arthrospira platensis SPKY1]
MTRANGVSDRERLMREWLDVVLPAGPARMAPASSDASFRRYFRVWGKDGRTRLVVGSGGSIRIRSAIL